MELRKRTSTGHERPLTGNAEPCSWTIYWIEKQKFKVASQDSSVGGASAFEPRGPRFESCLFQSSRKWHWAATLAVASLYQGVKLGPGLGLGIQIWLWGSLHASKSRVWVMMGPSWLWNPWAESTKARNREYQWFHKNGDLSPQKNEKRTKKLNFKSNDRSHKNKYLSTE